MPSAPSPESARTQPLPLASPGAPRRERPRDPWPDDTQRLPIGSGRGCSLGACVVGCRDARLRSGDSYVLVLAPLLSSASFGILAPDETRGRVLRDAVLAVTVVVAYWTAKQGRLPHPARHRAQHRARPRRRRRARGRDDTGCDRGHRSGAGSRCGSTRGPRPLRTGTGWMSRRCSAHSRRRSSSVGAEDRRRPRPPVVVLDAPLIGVIVCEP